MDTRPGTSLRALGIALAALALLASGHAVAAAGVAGAGCLVIEPVTISRSTALSFGTFAAGTAGTVTISTRGVRTNSGLRPLANESAPAAAIVVVTGGRGATFSIGHGASAALSRTTGSETMTLTTFSDLRTAKATGGAAGTQTIHIGGTLNLGPGQASGDYAGDIAVTVEYN